MTTTPVPSTTDDLLAETDRHTIALASNRGLELDDARKAHDLLMRVIGTLESDTLAASFQSMAQYRKHLLEVAKGEA